MKESQVTFLGGMIAVHAAWTTSHLYLGIIAGVLAVALFILSTLQGKVE